MKDDTKVVTSGRYPEKNHGVVNPPVYHASTIVFESVAAWEESRGSYTSGQRRVTYGRSGTPTHHALEDAILALDGGARCRLYPSGVAAIASTLSAYLNAGDHILMVDSVYGPARRFCSRFLRRFGVDATYFDPHATAEELDALIRPETKLVYLESPGSLTFEVQDVPALAEAAQARDCLVAFDNTWASPLYFKPLQHGVDIVIQAGTKYLVGHSDVMLGAVTVRDGIDLPLYEATQDLGMAAGPDDVYLAQRGLRTLSVRLERHWRSGIAAAEWLGARPEVDCVMHPALPDDPGHELWRRDFLGASGLFGVTLKPCSKAALDAFVDSLALFGLGASWGGYESLILITRPNQTRVTRPWPHDGPTLRFHIGLEDIDDLIADLERGFDALARTAD